MRRHLGKLLAAGVVGAWGLWIVPANATTDPEVYCAETDWLIQDTAPDGSRTDAALSEISSDQGVDLTKDGPPATFGTSAENVNLGREVEIGDAFSVHYELLDGAGAEAGAVRLFYYDHPDANTNTDLPSDFAFAPNDGAMEGTLSLIVPSDLTLGTVGVVYDLSNDKGGTVRFTDLKVGDTPIAFTSSACEEPEPPATTDTTLPPDTEVDLPTNCGEAAELPDQYWPHLDGDRDGVSCEEDNPVPSAPPAQPVVRQPSFTG